MKEKLLNSIRKIFGLSSRGCDRSESSDFRAFVGLSQKRHLGDYPESAMCRHYNIAPDALYPALEAAGLSYFKITPLMQAEARHAARENWLYVYDEKDLQGFLNKRSKVLLEAEWPTKAADFVTYLSYVTAPAQTKIFDLINECYGGDGSHSWLLKNKNRVSFEGVLQQREDAEITKHRFKAFQMNDPEGARFLIDLASTGQHLGAIRDVSYIYERGLGVAQDLVEAAFWDGLFQHRRGAGPVVHDLPDPYARQSPPDFDLTRDQWEEVNNRIRNWRPTPFKKERSPSLGRRAP